MRIGILTFHWATNYGAVLQTYALQSFIMSLGHEVRVINYMPSRYDISFWRLFKNGKLFDFLANYETYLKEKAITKFRNNHLSLTKRYTCCEELTDLSMHFDIIISGSDQVLNPYFLLNGEGNGIVTTTYFLGFPFSGRRIGYAVSFGCVHYPKEALPIASEKINAFDEVGVREMSGIEIVKSMGRSDAKWVPDPTILMNRSFYEEMIIENQSPKISPYTFCFFIRNIKERRKQLSSLAFLPTLLWNNEDKSYSIEGWLGKIYRSDMVVTDSYHCALMCLQFHKSFVFMNNQSGMEGMNDRIYSILNKLNINNRIISKESELFAVMQQPIDWETVDAKLNDIKHIGFNFLKENIMA